MKGILKRGLSFALALIMVVGLLPVTTFAAVDSTGRPKDVNNTLVLAIYTGTGFPGEPAVYGTEQYKNINSSFAVKSGATFSSSAAAQLDWNKIDKDIVEGAASSNTSVWGVYDANGTKDYFLSNASIIQPENEAKIIRAVKTELKNMSDEEVLNQYEIVWYVIKLQHSPGSYWWSSGTTEWHIDGVIKEKQYISINYYGNGNTSGNAPLGTTTHTSGAAYTVLDKNTMTKKINGVEVAFLGWSAKADGTGEEAGFYQPGDVINPTQSISLYAMWDTTTQYTATVNTYLDGKLASEDDTHGEERNLYLSTDNVYFYEMTEDTAGTYTAKITGNGKFHLYYKNADGSYTQVGNYQLTIYNQNGNLDIHHYSVTYNPNNGTFEKDPGQNAYYYGSTVTAISDVPTREGYRFLGWKDADGKLIQPGEVVTDSIEKPVVLTAQWEKTVNVTVNVTINHEGGDGYDQAPEKDHVTFTVASKANQASPYLEVGETLTLTKTAHNGFDYSVNGNVTKYEGYTLTDMPGGEAQYTVVTSKSGYETNITHRQDASGNWVINVVMTYKPSNFDLDFTVEVDDSVPAEYVPDAAIVKVTFWAAGKGVWETITQQAGSEPGVRVDLDQGSGSGSYPVWKYESNSETPYGYRVEVTSFVYPDGTIVPASAVQTDLVWSDNVYTATMDDVIGGQKYVELDGAYYDKTSDDQKGTLNVVITMDLHNVTFKAQGGKVNGKSEQKLEKQYQIPAFKDYIPTREGGYIFNGWYEDAACTIPAAEGKDLTADVTLYAKWIDPLTVSGTVTISGTYQQNGETVDVHDIDRATEAVVVLQELRNGTAFDVDSENVSFGDYEDAGSADYRFTGIPSDGKNYQIHVLVLNYGTTYDNESDADAVYTAKEYAAVFGDDNVADVDAYLEFVPPSYDQVLKVDASEIGAGYRPNTVLSEVMYRDSGDNHAFQRISQHDVEPYGVNIWLTNGTGSGKQSVWKWHTDGTLYDYQMNVTKVDDEVFDSDSAPFYITYEAAAYWNANTEAPSGELKATLHPKMYLVTFDLNAGKDPVTGMEAYKNSETGNYETIHTWSFVTELNNPAPVREGYNFLGWETDVTGASGAKIEAQVHENVVLKAKWEKLYDVKTVADPAEGGTVTGEGTYAEGSEVTITATAAVGYTFDGWFENEVLVTKEPNYTFKIDKDHAFTAKFTMNRHTVSAEAEPAAGGTTSGSDTYNYGTDVTVSAVTNPGYTFEGWFKGSTLVTRDLQFDVTVVENLAYVAKFKLNQHTLTTTADPYAGGKTEGDGTFDYGTKATVTATAETGYTFAGWYENDEKISDSAEYRFDITGNRKLTAKFEKIVYQVTATAEEGGEAEGTATYHYGDSAVVEATANEGYAFTGWYENDELVSENAKYTFVITGDRELTAQFTKKSYQVTANAEEGGEANGTATYHYGASAAVEAFAGEGYNFAGWYENGKLVSEDAKYTFGITDHRELTAKFAKKSYQITANAEEGGEARGTGTYLYGDTAVVEAIANEKFNFVGWYENNMQVSDEAVYEFNVTGDRVLTAKFNAKPGYNITVTHTEGGTADGGGYYTEGETVTVTAISKDGYLFTGWYEGDEFVSSDELYSFEVKADRTLKATFSKSHIITTIAQDGGSVKGGGEYRPLDSVTITAAADSDHYFVGWYNEKDELITAETSYTIIVKEERTFTAKFEKKVSYKCDFVYIFGYEDSKIGAEGPLLRGELAQMIYRLVKQNDAGISSGDYVFNDTTGEWYQTGISYMAAQGAIKIKPNAYPHVQVSRGETYKMICLGLGFTEDADLGFSDYAAILRNSGFISGDGAVTAKIKRYEFCELFNAILGRTNYELIDTTGKPVTHESYGYIDLDPSASYYETMLIATSTFTDGRVDMTKRAQRNPLDEYSGKAY